VLNDRIRKEADNSMKEYQQLYIGLHQNPELTESAVGHMKSILGEENLQLVEPTMTGEDFSLLRLLVSETGICR
jgi:hypothetical protein